MLAYRIRSGLVAIAKTSGRASLITLEPGTVVRTLADQTELPGSGLIDVQIEAGEIVSVFRQDLESRGERIDANRA